jgi:hypothetical protein
MVETMSDNELRPAARSVVDIARDARTPNDAHRERAYQALLAGLGGTAAVGTTKVAAAAAKVAVKGTLAWLKWAGPAALIASVGGGGYVLSLREPVHAPRPAQVARAAPVVSASSAQSPVPRANAEPEASARRATALTPPLKPGPKPSADALVQELSLLHQALAASRSGNASRALELAREHARRYPNSRLGIERSAIEVRSLCSLGRPAEARKVAERLRSQAPSSPVSAALKDTCVGK